MLWTKYEFSVLTNIYILYIHYIHKHRYVGWYVCIRSISKSIPSEITNFNKKSATIKAFVYCSVYSHYQYYVYVCWTVRYEKEMIFENKLDFTFASVNTWLFSSIRMELLCFLAYTTRRSNIMLWTARMDYTYTYIWGELKCVL